MPNYKKDVNRVDAGEKSDESSTNVATFAKNAEKGLQLDKSSKHTQVH